MDEQIAEASQHESQARMKSLPVENAASLSQPGSDAPWLNLAGGMGGLLLAVFAAIMFRTQWVGYSDFDQVYLAGVAWRKGLSPYEGHLLPAFSIADGPTNALLCTYYYAPLCGMLMAPFSLLPFPAAVLAWKIMMCGTFLCGCWRLMGHLPYFADPRLRLFWVGLTACSGSLRWCLKQLQPSLFVTGLLILFVCFLIERRRTAAFLCAVLVSIKVTFLLPAFGILLILREYRFVGQLIGVLLLLNGLAVIPTGVETTLRTYRHALATFEDEGKMTRPDALDFLTPYLTAQPDSPLASLRPQNREPGHWSGEQVHYPFLVSAWGASYSVARTAGHIFSLITVGVFFALWRRARETARRHDPEEILMQFAAIMAMSLFVVYHQRYDLIALIPGLFVALSLRRIRSLRRICHFASAVILLLCFALSGQMLEWWHACLIVPNGWLVLVPICGYLALSITICLVLLAWKRTAQGHCQEEIRGENNSRSGAISPHFNGEFLSPKDG